MEKEVVMRIRIFAVLLAVIVSAGMIACGGGGGGGGSFGFLVGTWFGTWESQGSYIEALEMTIDSKGRISNVLGDGIIYGNGSGGDLAGQITEESDPIYSVDWNYGSTGGFILGGDDGHFAYLDDEFFVGIVQKAPAVMPAFNLSDYEGTWNGYTVTVDAGMNVVDELDSVIYVNNQLDVIGTTVSGAFSGSIQSWRDQINGVAGGTDTAGTATFSIFLSYDKQFAATYACPNGFVDFDECEYGGWEKQ